METLEREGEGGGGGVAGTETMCNCAGSSCSVFASSKGCTVHIVTSCPPTNTPSPCPKTHPHQGAMQKVFQGRGSQKEVS